jgi:hypothetical protein
VNRKTRDSTHSAGESRDDAANADADIPWQAKPAPKGEGPDVPDPVAEKMKQGEGPDLDDKGEGDGLGPPDGHGDD